MPWDPFLLKKLLKSKICESSEQYRRPTDVLKMVEKSKFSANVHAQYMNSSLCLQLHVPKKKRKTQRKIQRNAKSKRALRLQRLNVRHHVFSKLIGHSGMGWDSYTKTMIGSEEVWATAL